MSQEPTNFKMYEILKMCDTTVKKIINLPLSYALQSHITLNIPNHNIFNLYIQIQKDVSGICDI